MALLKVFNVTKRGKENDAVKDISFIQEPLEKIVIAGETGSGKTTLLKIIGGLVQPESGEILFENKKIIGPYDQLIPGHPGIAYLSQHFELRNNYWVHEILEYANQLPAETADELYAVCRIQHLLNRRTNELSGGEKQRIALARLLIGAPKLLLLDEPFSNLDAVHKNIIKSVIEDIGKRLNITCMMVSHDAPDILSWADKILILKDGLLVQKGSPEEIYRQPVNEYCAGLFGPYNLFHIKGKNILIRPEQINIVSKGNHLIKGVVQQVLFFGSHYSIDVMVDDELLSVKTGSRGFNTGEDIYLSFKEDDWWYI